MNNNIIYQIDIREFFNRLKSEDSKIKTLLDLPDKFFFSLSQLGINYLWLLGIYEPSQLSKKISIEMKELHRRYYESLPDWKEEDVIGSPYAIKSYKIWEEIGGEKIYHAFREKIYKKFGLKIILDFVPNHLAIDNPIVKKHPEYFINIEDSSKFNAEDYTEIEINNKKYRIAHGRDPYFPAWKDTLQLDYRSKGARNFMINELLKLSEKCDGVRCDMSMLVLSEIFFNNWKQFPPPKDLVPAAKEFWFEAIQKVKKVNPDLIFIAEVYWNKEQDLLDLGFDYVYGKKFYEFIVHNNIGIINEYIKRIFANHRKRFLFLENHDEPRSAHIFSTEHLKAVATLVYSLPSMKLIYDGQLEGRKFPHAIQLKRLHPEPIDYDLRNHYLKLFSAIKNSTISRGYFKPLTPQPAWQGSVSNYNFVIFFYEDDQLNKDLIVINFSDYQSQCKVKIESFDLIGKTFLIKDRLSSEEYIRSGDEMFYSGLYLDLKPYQSQIFQFIPQ